MSYININFLKFCCKLLGQHCFNETFMPMKHTELKTKQKQPVFKGYIRSVAQGNRTLYLKCQLESVDD